MVIAYKTGRIALFMVGFFGASVCCLSHLVSAGVNVDPFSYRNIYMYACVCVLNCT